jgi:adenylylsulfate kinase
MTLSLFIGRWQPPHEGHKKLIGKRKNVVIAVRDTPISKKNPYTFRQRKKMLKEMFGDIKIIKIPDISEVCYGRKVGYKITRIKLNKKLEDISATKIREASMGRRRSKNIFPRH